MIYNENGTFLLKINVSQFGYELTTNTGQTPKVSGGGNLVVNLKNFWN